MQRINLIRRLAELTIEVNSPKRSSTLDRTTTPEHIPARLSFSPLSRPLFSLDLTIGSSTSSLMKIFQFSSIICRTTPKIFILSRRCAVVRAFFFSCSLSLSPFVAIVSFVSACCGGVSRCNNPNHSIFYIVERTKILYFLRLTRIRTRIYPSPYIHIDGRNERRETERERFVFLLLLACSSLPVLSLVLLVLNHRHRRRRHHHYRLDILFSILSCLNNRQRNTD